MALYRLHIDRMTIISVNPKGKKHSLAVIAVWLSSPAAVTHPHNSRRRLPCYSHYDYAAFSPVLGPE